VGYFINMTLNTLPFVSSPQGRGNIKVIAKTRCPIINKHDYRRSPINALSRYPSCTASHQMDLLDIPVCNIPRIPQSCTPSNHMQDPTTIRDKAFVSDIPTPAEENFTVRSRISSTPEIGYPFPYLAGYPGTSLYFFVSHLLRSARSCYDIAEIIAAPLDLLFAQHTIDDLRAYFAERSPQSRENNLRLRITNRTFISRRYGISSTSMSPQ